MNPLRVQISGDSMWPTYPDGTQFDLDEDFEDYLKVNDVVLALHPNSKGLKIVKRIQSVKGDWIFLVGDNPDPLSSDDSHNFGAVHLDNILGICIPIVN